MSGLRHPLAPLALTAALALLLLALPLRLPMGPNYWDLHTYVDVAHRMAFGQIPHVDFFIPVGALGYALFALVAKAFPAAHPLLAVQYAILIVVLPLMAAVTLEAAKRSRGEALALAVPFAMFALLPLNTQPLYPSPGLDAYGNYNRHIALLLYVLSCNLLFVADRAKASWIAALLLAAMLMVKVTGFVVGALLVAHALLAGRLCAKHGLAAAAAAAAALAFAEWRYGLVGAYAADILQLARANTGSLLPRVLTVLSTRFDVVAAAAALALVAAWRTRASRTADARQALRERSLAALRRVIDADWVWLLSLLAAGAIFETQNTGSQEFILIWPALLIILRGIAFPAARRDGLPLLLIAATALPTPMALAHRAARAALSAPGYAAVPAPLLGPFGRVSAKPDILRHARAMLAYHPDARVAEQRLADSGVLPSYILFSEIDFQAGWLLGSEEAAAALLAWEAANGRRLARVATLDFVDPLPAMLAREPVIGLTVGNDPERMLTRLDDRTRRAFAEADAVLLPRCPVLASRDAIAAAYEPLMRTRRRIPLTACYDMLLRE